MILSHFLDAILVFLVALLVLAWGEHHPLAYVVGGLLIVFGLLLVRAENRRWERYKQEHWGRR